MDHVIFNHRLLARNEAHIALDDRGFRYGDSVFDTIRIANGKPYQFDWHLERLQRGLDAVLIPFDTSTLVTHGIQLIKQNTLLEGLLRIQITRGRGGRGYLPDAGTVPTLLIETLPLPQTPNEPVKLWFSTYEKISAKALPVCSKLSQGMNSTLARIEAEAKGCFDALMTNAKGEICETASANIFWQKDGMWYTPALSCGVLEGSTRAALLRLLGARAQETVAATESLMQADAVAICNAAYGVIGVSQLLPNDMRWHNLAAINELSTRWQQDVQHHTRIVK